MSHGVDSNAMTETALGLAMAFFAIMVLAMVSMGIPPDAARPATLALAQQDQGAGKPEQAAAAPDRQLVVHWRGRLLDARLQPLAEDQLQGSVTLAVTPTLTLADAMQLKARLGRSDILIATLDQAWLTRLEESFP